MDEWVRKFDITAKSSGSPFSNYSMFENKKYFIPEDKYEEFLMVYAKCIDSNEKLIIQEIITDHAFKMFIDVDFIEPTSLSSEYILNFSHTLQKTLLDLFGDSEDLTYIISTTQPKKVTKSSSEYIKTGLHINYPFLYVNSEIAIKLRNNIINGLVLKFGERSIEVNPWEDVIDIYPYNSNSGLKMHGSIKPLKCPGCIGRGVIKIPKIKAIKKYRKKFYNKGKFDYGNLKNRSKSELEDPILTNLVEDYNTCMDCDICNGKRKILENRFYSAEYVFNHDGTISEPKTELLKTNTLECMRMTSFRCKSSDKYTINLPIL